MIVTAAEVRVWVAAGESLTVEFKGESRERFNDTDLVEAVACMANARGGVLLVGVEDDGAITGATPRHGTYTDARRIEALIGNWTVPSCPVECALVDIDGVSLLVVKIPNRRPITATNRGVYKHRLLDVFGKPQCLPFYPQTARKRNAESLTLARYAEGGLRASPMSFRGDPVNGPQEPALFSLTTCHTNVYATGP